MSTTTTTTTTEVAQAITADNVRTLFPDVNTGLATALSNNSSAREGGELTGYDEEQIKMMDEVCIVLDENDIPIGSASKKICTHSFEIVFLPETLGEKPVNYIPSTDTPILAQAI